MFGSFGEAIKTVERLKARPVYPYDKYVERQKVLGEVLRTLRAELEKHEEDFAHWCEGQGIEQESIFI